MKEIRKKEWLLLTNTRAPKWHTPLLIVLGLVLCILSAFAIWQYSCIEELEYKVNSYSNELSNNATKDKMREREFETLEESLDSTKEELEELVQEYPIRITDIMLANVRNDGTIVNESTSIVYGTTNWISASVYYIRPTLKLVAYKSGRLDIGYKIYHNGKLDYNSSVSSVFSGRPTTVELSKGENKVELLGWGNDSGTSYQSGEHQIEVWTQGKCYGRYSFEIR